MKRVLIFSTEFPPGPGGIGAHAYQVARNLSLNFWQVSVLTKQEYASPQEMCLFNQEQTFPIEVWPRSSKLARQTLDRFNALSKKLKSFQPQILLASGESAVWLTALLLQSRTFRNTHWVAVWHGMTPTHSLLRRLSRWAYQKPQAVIAVSQYGLDQLFLMGVQPQASLVIYNGADPDLFHPLPENESKQFRNLYAPADAQVLLTVGHVSERKGQEIVIRALPRILKAFPKVHYWMVGLPTLQKELEQLAKRLGVGEQVHFLGKLSQQDLCKAYNACDLFLMTSRHSQDGQFEGYGIAAVEAALCGKAAVVSDNSGLAEAILPGETGLLVQENDPDSTAQAVIELLSNAVLRNQMGARAQQRALSEQTWENSVQAYDHLLSKLVGDLQTRIGNPI